MRGSKDASEQVSRSPALRQRSLDPLPLPKPLLFLSSPAAFLDYECNWRSKSSPVLVPIEIFKATLAMAMDDIGCRDSYCEIGWQHVNMKKAADAPQRR